MCRIYGIFHLIPSHIKGKSAFLQTHKINVVLLVLQMHPCPFLKKILKLWGSSVGNSVKSEWNAPNGGHDLLIFFYIFLINVRENRRANQEWLIDWLIDLLIFVFNTTFSNISAISWRPILVVEEAGENHQPWASNATGKLYHLQLRVECTLCVIYKAGREPTPYWW